MPDWRSGVLIMRPLRPPRSLIAFFRRTSSAAISANAWSLRASSRSRSLTRLRSGLPYGRLAKTRRARTVPVIRLLDQVLKPGCDLRRKQTALAAIFGHVSFMSAAAVSRHRRVTCPAKPEPSGPGVSIGRKMTVAEWLRHATCEVSPHEIQVFRGQVAANGHDRACGHRSLASRRPYISQLARAYRMSVSYPAHLANREKQSGGQTSLTAVGHIALWLHRCRFAGIGSIQSIRSKRNSDDLEGGSGCHRYAVTYFQR